MLRSLSLKFAVLVLLFAGIPLVLYSQFRQADQERRQIVASSLGTQGRIIAESLRSDLNSFGKGGLEALNNRLRKVAVDDVRIKLLFRPKEMHGSEDFFYIASSSSQSTEYLSQEREELYAAQVLAGLEDSCEGNQPTSRRYRNPQGHVEVLTSIVPLLLDSGCWLVLTSSVVDQRGQVSLLGGAYWQEREILAAVAIFVASAILVLSLFVSIWLGLRQFARLARHISTNIGEAETFADRNKVPELDGVAREFDRLVSALRRSAQSARERAEENAHAAKGPLAVIAQSLEPLKRLASQLDARARRAIELIELSVERLDDLISEARDIDTAEADLMTAPRQRIDVVALLRELVGSYRQQTEGKKIDFVLQGIAKFEVLANPPQLETAIENVLDNSVSFSPDDGNITIDINRRDHGATILITDDGPGVPEDQLERIFERSISLRKQPDSGPAAAGSSQNYGIGLWIARRNITYAGGTIRARNATKRGLEIEIVLPAPDG